MDNKFGLSQKSYDLIVSCLKSYPEIKQAAIFGSRALGNYKPGSDVDIALYGKIDQILLARIKGQLEEVISTPYLFDVVVYTELENENLKSHIDRHGIVIL